MPFNTLLVLLKNTIIGLQNHRVHGACTSYVVLFLILVLANNLYAIGPLLELIWFFRKNNFVNRNTTFFWGPIV